MAEKDKKSARKHTAKTTKKAGNRMADLYVISGNRAEKKNKYCPKCGPGTFLGAHKDRVVCGTCHYVEFTKKN
ncbi:30S ribosomal protein S27ae [Candidatus Woesearchaeota archaeon]|nr:30S ribosomal protein S27ae [Candidatus Woesearchaeota archaeon]